MNNGPAIIVNITFILLMIKGRGCQSNRDNCLTDKCLLKGPGNVIEAEKKRKITDRILRSGAIHK